MSSMAIIRFATPFHGGTGPKFSSRPTVATPLKLRRGHYLSSASLRTVTVNSTTAAAAPTTFYEVLGVEAGATSQDIKTAYRNLARAVHPDVASNGSESADLFIRIHVAYSTLSDPGKRSEYDRMLCQRRTCFGQRPRICRNWETDQCW